MNADELAVEADRIMEGGRSIDEVEIAQWAMEAHAGSTVSEVEERQREMKAEITRLKGLIESLNEGGEFSRICPWCGSARLPRHHTIQCPAFDAWGGVR